MEVINLSLKGLPGLPPGNFPWSHKPPLLNVHFGNCNIGVCKEPRQPLANSSPTLCQPFANPLPTFSANPSPIPSFRKPQAPVERHGLTASWSSSTPPPNKNTLVTTLTHLSGVAPANQTKERAKPKSYFEFRTFFCVNSGVFPEQNTSTIHISNFFFPECPGEKFMN